MTSGVNFQQICSLPYLACREIKEKASVSKQWIVQRCQIISKNLTQTAIYNKNIKPFYERSIKPLTLTHKFLLVGVPPLVISISVVAFYTLGPLACTLSVLIGSVAIPFAWSIPFNYLDNYHKQEALPYIEAIQAAAKKDNLEEVEKNLVALKKLEISCLEKEVKELEEKFKIIQESRLSKKTKDNLGIFIVYVEELSKSIHLVEKEVKNEKIEAELEKQPDPIKNELIDHAQKLEQALDMELNVGYTQIVKELKILEDSRFSNFKQGIDKLQRQFKELTDEQKTITQEQGKQLFLENINEFKEYIKKNI